MSFINDSISHHQTKHVCRLLYSALVVSNGLEISEEEFRNCTIQSSPQVRENIFCVCMQVGGEVLECHSL